jgi:hypothetical protein
MSEETDNFFKKLLDKLKEAEDAEEPKFPMTVNEIKVNSDEKPLRNGYGKCGDFVAVRPCGEKYGDKTYLGVMLGDLSLVFSYSFNRETGALTINRSMYNPAMFVPDLNEVIYGCGSWWGRIKKIEDLEQITDADTNNVWYVKALKSFDEKEEEG